MIEKFGILLSFLGVFLGFLGVALTFVTFFTPAVTLRFALSSVKRWHQISFGEFDKKLYRNSFLSGFVIEVDNSEAITENFEEPWMEALYRPDKNASTYRVKVMFNGLPVLSEVFLAYDGGRNFIPLPKYSRIGERTYLTFDETQKQLAKIVGATYRDEPFEDIYKKILGSKHNPVILSYPDVSSPETLLDFEERLEKFKVRSAFL